MSNSIQRRAYYAVRVRLCSPLNVTGSESVFTDADVIRNGKGELFIPGTSIAGALRGYLGEEKDQESVFGFSRVEKDDKDVSVDKGKMSSVFISDLNFEKMPSLRIRDGVSLTEQKGVDNKYDMEIIETGAEGTFFLTFVIREQDAWDDEALVNAWIQAINRKAVRLGKNKNRGFGYIECTEVFQRCFSSITSDVNKEKAEAAREWVAFMDSLSGMRVSGRIGKEDLESLYGAPFYLKEEGQDEGTDPGFVRIRIPLKLSGGISIRKYSSVPGKADYEQLTCNGAPVIPGTSWNGAIRSRVRSILKELGVKNVDGSVEKWFGTVRGNEAAQSMVAFSESVLEGSAKVPVARNRINRFTAGTITGALYSELSRFGGTTTLEMLIRKEDGYEELTGMMLIVARELTEGYVPVGGLASVGRGVFEADGETVTEGAKPEECERALFTYILRMKEGEENEVV